MTILLDSSVIIDFLRARRDRRGFIARRVREGDDFACTAISVAEVYAGMRPNEAQETEHFLGSLRFIEISFDIARRAGEIKYQCARKGRTIDITDSIIGAAALDSDLLLATDNRKDFPMAGLRFAELPEGKN
jgi:tRNA(fMet)-specific endonuclease VapC